MKKSKSIMKMICPKNEECAGCNHAMPHDEIDTCRSTVCKHVGIVKCVKIEEEENVKS